MEKEEVTAAAIPAPSDCKRKHEDLESNAPDPLSNVNENDSVRRDEGVEEENGAAAGVGSDESEAKRPRLDESSDGLGVTENGFQERNVENAELPSVEQNIELEDSHELTNEAPDNENNNLPCDDDQPKVEIQPSSVADTQLESAQPQPPSTWDEHQEPSAKVPQRGDVYSEEQQPAAQAPILSRKMEIPIDKVGVLIGRTGDTIRILQINSGAKIQITRDVDSDPYSTTRRAEIVGTLENINNAERLIKDVIAEADAGGSPSLAARGLSNVHGSGAAEQINIQIPNEKVGMVIGKSGETIKNLQTRSGARIQLVPQHLPEGDQSLERTVRVSGDKKQIEMAREMIKEVTKQTPRSRSGGYNHHHHQQGYRPRGSSQSQWGHHRGSHSSQSGGYNYQQRGSYPPQSQNSQYGPPYGPPVQPYGGSNYPPQQMGSSRSGSFGSGWEQRPPPPAMQQQGPGGGYDYYGGHMGDAPPSYHGGHGPSPTPIGPQGNYNYGYGQGQPQTAAPPYSSQAPYNEAKYENQGHLSYGGGGSQPGSVGAGYPHPGYAPPPQDQQYGKAPISYPQQQYVIPPRGAQPGDNMSYQATQQQYAQNAAPPPQTQAYPQTYPQPYGSDGYNVNQQHQLPPVAPGSVAPVYPQQGSVYVQQQGLSGYAQTGPTGSYGSYPSGYTEQPTAQNTAAAAAVYGGYQGAVDPAAAYASAPPPTGYAQPAPTQLPTGYAQPAPTQPPAGQAGYAQPAPTQPPAGQAGYAQPAPTQPPAGQAGYAQPAPTQPPAGQSGYAQPAPTQPPTGYDHSGSYGNPPVTYGKSL